MKRTCPKCEDAPPLEAAARDAMRCPNCRGVFVARGARPELDEAEDADPSVSGNAVGGQCPVDRSIMSRAEVGSIHLERCNSCKGVWFDAGEWSMLAEQQLLDHLDEFWTAEWRTKQRRQKNAEAYEQRLREEFGDDLLRELRAVAGKLRGHERRSQALALLRDESA